MVDKADVDRELKKLARMPLPSEAQRLARIRERLRASIAEEAADMAKKNRKTDRKKADGRWRDTQINALIVVAVLGAGFSYWLTFNAPHSDYQRLGRLEARVERLEKVDEVQSTSHLDAVRNRFLRQRTVQRESGPQPGERRKK